MCHWTDTAEVQHVPGEDLLDLRETVDVFFELIAGSDCASTQAEAQVILATINYTSSISEVKGKGSGFI